MGSDAHRGIDEIRAFCHGVKDGRRFDVDLLSLNIAGGEAAFHFRVTTGGRRMDVIDVMTFDDDGKITTMRAYWRPDNVALVYRGWPRTRQRGAIPQVSTSAHRGRPR